MIKDKPIAHNVKELIPALVSFVEKNPDIIALYLFGSYARGKISSLSDLDLAVLLSDSVNRKEYFDQELALRTEFARILKTDEIDLVILNQAPDILAYKIFSQGKILFCRDHKTRARFQARVVDQYLDFQPYRKFHLDAMLKRIKEGKFGG